MFVCEHVAARVRCAKVNSSLRTVLAPSGAVTAHARAVMDSATPTAPQTRVLQGRVALGVIAVGLTRVAQSSRKHLSSPACKKCLGAPSTFCKLPRRHTQRIQSGQATARHGIHHCLKDSSVILPSQEQLEECPIHHVPLTARATQSWPRKRKGDESPSEKLRRLSSSRHWDVALVPFPEDFVPLPTPTETGPACPAPWAFPRSLCALEPRATKLRVLAIAEAGDAVTADHLLQMASLAAEHKPTVLGIPGQVPIPHQLECTVVLLQSLHALFQLLTSGNTMQHCPQAASFAVALGTAARQDNGHIVSMAASLALALRAGRSTLAVAGVSGAGKTRSLTFLLAWLALTTHLKIAVVHKENPAGRAITKLLTAFDLEPDHQRYFIRPVRREEAETNTACTDYDLRASEAASYIPGCHVVIVTTGLVWDQKGQTHSTLNTHMENVDLLIGEEAQQDMDLKSAFAPTVPQQPFFRLLLGDPKQSPGGVADGQRAHRTLLLKASIGLRAPTTWYMPHEIPAVTAEALVLVT